jgi:competence ComEA-like helix-hairpin-helix protein
MAEPVTFFITWSMEAGPNDSGKHPAPPEYVHSFQNSMNASLPHVSPAAAATTSPSMSVTSRKAIPLLWPGPVQLALAALILVAAAALAYQTFRSTGPVAETDPTLLQPLDLNLASEAELRLLPGVGPKLARGIVERRQQLGRFRCVDDLQSVPGIGPVTLARLRLRVIVDDDASSDSEITRPVANAAGSKSKSKPAAKMIKTETARGSEIIDVNRASAADLRKIPGVGPVISGNIVAYRAQNGPFRNVEDLCKVAGIKSKTLEKIKPFITLETEHTQIVDP